MSIKFACTCGKAYKVPEKVSGKRVKCKKCGETIRVPSQSQSGVVSVRASAVSKRSVLESQRLQPGRPSAKSGGADRPSARSGGAERPSAKSGGAERPSAKSGGAERPSAKSGGAERASSKSRRSGRTSAESGRASKQSRRGGGDGTKTERFAPIDLSEGNELKKYRARKAEEFQRGEGRLTYYENGKAVKAFRLSKGEATIGRDASCAVRLGLPSVSREHGKIEYKLGTFIVTDRQSKNGLVVNGRPVRRSSLRNGDILQLGEGILRLDC